VRGKLTRSNDKGEAGHSRRTSMRVVLQENSIRPTVRVASPGGRAKLTRSSPTAQCRKVGSEQLPSRPLFFEARKGFCDGAVGTKGNRHANKPESMATRRGSEPGFSYAKPGGWAVTARKGRV
jgi:hypothetical protein